MVFRSLLLGACLTSLAIAAPPGGRPQPTGHPNGPPHPPKAPGPRPGPKPGPPKGPGGPHFPHNNTDSYEGNPFADIQMYPNPYYTNEIYTYAIPNMDDELAAQAARVAEVPTFQWLDTLEKLSLMKSTLKEIRAKNRKGANPPIAGTFVIYNFPDRDCSAEASAGELVIAEGGEERYRTEYIDEIAKLVKEYSDIRMIFVFEPDGLANLITNLAVPKCANAAPVLRSSTIYAWSTLNFPNVALYIDAGHAGWLGWPDNLPLTAGNYTSLYRAAGSPAAVRGLVTNVSNYNGYRLASPPNYTDPNPNYDESRFHAALTPYLDAAGFPAHFIVDQGRSGQQPGGRVEWGHWCNVRDSGFGTRPVVNSGSQEGLAANLDAIVWVKPGGEGDGTSDPAAERFDETCVSVSSVTPAPEAGAWFQEYFEMLLRNAVPSFA